MLRAQFSAMIALCRPFAPFFVVQEGDMPQLVMMLLIRVSLPIRVTPPIMSLPKMGVIKPRVP